MGRAPVAGFETRSRRVGAGRGPERRGTTAVVLPPSVDPGAFTLDPEHHRRADTGKSGPFVDDGAESFRPFAENLPGGGDFVPDAE